MGQESEAAIRDAIVKDNGKPLVQIQVLEIIAVKNDVRSISSIGHQRLTKVDCGLFEEYE